MTAKEYIEKYSRINNNHLRIGPVPKDDGPFCATCFTEDDEIVEAKWNQQQNGWICPKGHIGRNDGLAKGGVF